jgi:hypothetical protein
MTALRCPVCRADNSIPSQCRRCKADLFLLWELEQQRQRDLAIAMLTLARSDPDNALELLDRVEKVRSDDDSRRLRALCHLFRHDFAAAWKWARGGP